MKSNKKNLNVYLYLKSVKKYIVHCNKVKFSSSLQNLNSHET